jgi:hypothetical protein
MTTQTVTTQSAAALSRRRSPDLRFWLCFALLNAALFLPFYLLNREGASLLPLEWLHQRTPQATLAALLLWRDNADPFRVNVELPILLALWVNVAWIRRRAFRWFVMLTYAVAFVYYLYEGIMVSLYQVDPVFYNHYFLIRDGLEFLLDHLNLSTGVYLSAALAALAVVTLIAWTMRTVVAWDLPDQLSRGSRLALTALALALAASALAYRGVLADPHMVMSSLAFKLEKNIAESVSLYEDVAHFNDRTVRQVYDYAGHTLARKPNIYLLFIESYGSVLYRRDDYGAAYLKLLDDEKVKLDAGGFHYASALSESPTWGGGSWLAYTSALFGLRVDSHPQYLSLLDRYSTQTQRYPDLGAYLRGQGYTYVWVTPLSTELKESMWEKYKRFYGVDRWLRFRDLAYLGPGFGWGPAPADQYVLNYTRDEALKDLSQPLVLFYLTENSHYPWIPQPSLVDDWRTLGLPVDQQPTAPDPEQITHEQRRQNYLTAVTYQLEMLVDFILRHAEEDALFVLVGDHQPPRVSRRADSYATPVHIVSRDAAVIASLTGVGFVEDLAVDPATVELTHQGIYSLLVHVLVQNYGKDPAAAPAFLPRGVVLPDWDAALPAP